jgi:Tol biopolymer transport system component
MLSWSQESDSNEVTKDQLAEKKDDNDSIEQSEQVTITQTNDENAIKSDLDPGTVSSAVPTATPTTTPTPPPTPNYEPVDVVNGVGNKCKVETSKNALGRLAFTLNYRGRRAIYGSDLTYETIYPVITEPGENFSPSISPDGKQIAFISTRTGLPQVYRASWDGSNVRQLTYSQLKKGYPSWSKDSSTIYFSAESDTAEESKNNIDSNVFSVKASSLEADIKPTTDDSSTDAKAKSKITSNEVRLTKFSGRNIAPSVHALEKAIAYSSNRFWPGWDICVFDVIRQQESCLLAGSHSFIKPQFSHDGNLLAFVQTQALQSQIGILNFKNRNTPNEYLTSTFHETDPSWGANDGELFVASGTSTDTIHSIAVKNLISKESSIVISCPEFSLKEPFWNVTTRQQLEEELITREFKMLKIVASSTNEHNEHKDYKAPYLR